MYSGGSFSVNYRYRDPAEKSERHETLFSVYEATILERKGRAFKYARGVDEIEAVLFEIGPTLWFVPNESHATTVYTRCRCVKPSLRFALTRR